MFKLLEIELRKLVPYRFFWISVAAYALLMPALFISLYRFNINVQSFSIGLELYNFPEVWHNSTYIAKWFNFLLYVFVLQMVTNEYQFRTIRQNIIDGLSPMQYLAGKALLLLVFALGSTALVGLLALLSGLFLSESVDYAKMGLKLEYLGFYFLQLLGYLSLALLIGSLLRKAGIAILGYMAYLLIIEAVLRYAPFMASLKPDIWGPYLPSQTFGSLLPNPLPSYLGMAPPAPVETLPVVLSIGYIVVFIAATGWLIAKRDL